MARVFLSHTNSDKLVVRRISAALREAGHDPWLDEERVLPGDSIPQAVERGLTECDFVLVFLSRIAVDKKWVEAERDAMLVRQFEDGRKRVIPVLLEPVDVPLLLQPLLRVDLFPDKAAYERGLKRIQAVLSGAQFNPRTPPPDPLRRRALLASGVVVLLGTTGGLAWFGWHQKERGIPAKELERLTDSCRELSRRLGAKQEGTGEFRASPYTVPITAAETAQVLTSLFASTHSGCGDFGLEQSQRGAKAILRLAKGFVERPKLTVNPIEAYRLFTLDQAPEAQSTIAVSWVILALSRYLLVHDDAEVRAGLVRFRKILLAGRLDDGAFEFSDDPFNVGRAHAYATTLALWALVECRIALGAGTGDELIQESAAWLAVAFPGPSKGDEVKIQKVNGLAAQVFWTIERAREIRSSSARTAQENRAASLLLRDLLKQCKETSSAGIMCAAADGKTPNGLGTNEPLVMLWLPWSTLAALQLVRAPPSDATDSELDALNDSARALVADLASRWNTSVDNYRYEPAEVLLAMAEAQRMQAGRDPYTATQLR